MGRQTPSGKKAYYASGKRFGESVLKSAGSKDFTSGVAIFVQDRDYQAGLGAPKGPVTLANGKQLSVDLNAQNTYTVTAPQQNAPEASSPSAESESNIVGSALKLLLLIGVGYAIYYVVIKNRD